MRVRPPRQTPPSVHHWKLLSPARRRRAVMMLVEHFEVSERQACRAIGQSRPTQRRAAPVPGAEEEHLRARLRELARAHPRYGYRRMTAILGREGYCVTSQAPQWLERFRLVPSHGSGSGQVATSLLGQCWLGQPSGHQERSPLRHQVRRRLGPCPMEKSQLRRSRPHRRDGVRGTRTVLPKSPSRTACARRFRARSDCPQPTDGFVSDSVDQPSSSWRASAPRRSQRRREMRSRLCEDQGDHLRDGINHLRAARLAYRRRLPVRTACDEGGQYFEPEAGVVVWRLAPSTQPIVRPKQHLPGEVQRSSQAVFAAKKGPLPTHA